MSEILVSASLMCSDFRYLEEELKDMEDSGVDYIHFDIMDGLFVPNYTLGPCLIEAVKNMCSLPIDAHLMIEKPERHVELFADCGCDLISIHQETCVHLHRTIEEIKKQGIKAGVALNPATSLTTLEDILPELDFVLIMTVEPGFARQKLVPYTIEKIARFKKMMENRGLQIPIEVDGNVSFENAPKMVSAGASILVAGTSSIYSKESDIASGVQRLKQI